MNTLKIGDEIDIVGWLIQTDTINSWDLCGEWYHTSVGTIEQIDKYENALDVRVNDILYRVHICQCKLKGM